MILFLQTVSCKNMFTTHGGRLYRSSWLNNVWIIQRDYYRCNTIRLDPFAVHGNGCTRTQMLCILCLCKYSAYAYILSVCGRMAVKCVSLPPTLSFVSTWCCLFAQLYVVFNKIHKPSFI